MLLGEKAELQATLKKELIELEEKELQYYVNCCKTIGTQAAVVGMFSFTALTEARGLSDDSEYRAIIATLAWLLNLLVMMLETCVLVKSMQLTVLTPGLALRGPEGSMTRALEVMRAEYKRTHGIFIVGLYMILFSTALFMIWALDAYQQSLSAGMVMCGSILVATAIMVWQFKVLRNKLFSSRAQWTEEGAQSAAAQQAAAAKGSAHSRAPKTLLRLRLLQGQRLHLRRQQRVREQAQGQRQ